MPIESVSCSRNVICEVVNELTEESSITALTWFSNSTGKHDQVLRVHARSSA